MFRDGNTLKHTGPAPLIQDLDRLVHPSRYFTYQHLAMSRGCPGACTFCGSPLFWGTRNVRFHSPEWFFEEIRTLAGKGISHFYISDDTFTMDRDRVMALCRKLIHADLTITWHAISRVDRMDPHLLAMMRKAGCIQISYGVETGSDTIKKRLGKPIPNAVAVQAFQQTAAAGMIPRAYFIYGSPGETPDTIQESIDLLMQLQPLGAVFYMLVVFPGTRLYEQAKKTAGSPMRSGTRKSRTCPGSRWTGIWILTRSGSLETHCARHFMITCRSLQKMSNWRMICPWIGFMQIFSPVWA